MKPTVPIGCIGVAGFATLHPPYQFLSCPISGFAVPLARGLRNTNPVRSFITSNCHCELFANSG